MCLSRGQEAGRAGSGRASLTPQRLSLVVCNLTPGAGGRVPQAAGGEGAGVPLTGESFAACITT